MNAYVQNNTKHILNGETAALGCYEQGCWVVRCAHPLDHIFTSSDIAYGNVNFVEDILGKMDYKINSIGHVPDDLLPYAGRSIEKMTLRDALKRQNVFIKPDAQFHKRFNGTTLQTSFDYIQLAKYDEEDPVLVSPIINIVSEWRGFICQDELVDSRRYKGDFRVIPDHSVIEKHIKVWKDRPQAWSCDLGVTDKGETIIIECNDVMSLGWYGLVPSLVGRMLVVRWEEIHQKKLT